MPFKKGQSGNPKGRPPKGESWAEIARAVNTAEEKKKILKAMQEAAKAGDHQAAAFLRDTEDGRPAQRQIIAGDPDAPIAIIAGPRKAEKKMPRPAGGAGS